MNSGKNKNVKRTVNKLSGTTNEVFRSGQDGETNSAICVTGSEREHGIQGTRDDIDATPSILKKLNECFDGDVPSGISGATEKTISIYAGSDWEGCKDYKITMNDVIKHVADQQSSECAQLGGIFGEPGMVDDITYDCIKWFIFVNRKAFQEQAEAKGLTLQDPDEAEC